MSGRTGSDALATARASETAVGWPRWARRLVTAVLVFHFVALLAAAVGSPGMPPPSLVEQKVAGLFVPYYDLIDQGYNYHFYAPEPPSTPVIEATVHFGDGRDDEVVRIPERGVRPRLRYQRQLALAAWLFFDIQDAVMSGGDGSRSHYAQSYAPPVPDAPGCSSVTLHMKMHRIPDLREVGERLESRRGPKVDIDSEEYYDVPQWIGDFTCDAF